MKKIITKLYSIALNSNVSSVTMCSFSSAHQDLKVIHWPQVLKDFSQMSMVTKLYASLIKILKISFMLHQKFALLCSYSNLIKYSLLSTTSKQCDLYKIEFGTIQKQQQKKKVFPYKILLNQHTPVEMSITTHYLIPKEKLRETIIKF